MRRQTAGDLIVGDVLTYPAQYLSGEVVEYVDAIPERVLTVERAGEYVRVSARVFFGLNDGRRLNPGRVEVQRYLVLADRPVLVWS